jgi:hypothetical protein
MEKDEFIEKFASSENVQKRNQKAEEMSKGMIKFDYRRDVPSIEFCEVCVHPKGRTINTYEICMSPDDIDIPRLIEFRNLSTSYGQTEFGKYCQILPNLVVPPDPKMLMELGKHLDALMKMNIVVTVYDPKSDKRGSCPVNEDFFSSLREDEDYKAMSDAEIFQNFMMNFVEML